MADTEYIKSNLHTHSTFCDGKSTLEENVLAAEEAVQTDRVPTVEESAAEKAAEEVAVEENVPAAEEAEQADSAPTAEESDTEAENEGISAEGASLSLNDGETTISIGGETAAASLANLLNGNGNGLQAKLVVDLGGGKALEIPVEIQLALGTPAIVSTSME